MIEIVKHWFENGQLFATILVSSITELEPKSEEVFMKFIDNPYFTNIEKIDLLCRWILVHSIIYYQYDRNIVSDYIFDMNCKQLKRMIEEHPTNFRYSAYHYCMKDFDGCSGFDLPAKLNLKDSKKLTNIADMLIRSSIK